MSRKLLVALLIILVLGTAGYALAHRYYSDLPNRLSQHETLVLGNTVFVPGSQAALRVAVRDSSDGRPLEAAEIDVLLQPLSGDPLPVFSGTTNELGTADVNFTVPQEEDSYTLVVETRSRLGNDRLEQPVTLRRDYRILLTTDKPLYQPGQVIHLRALALSAFDLQAASGRELEITIADGKGNTVHRETLTTSDFGVAATDFQLAELVNTGNYKISVTMGNTSSEKTVTVENYVLPKFDVTLQTAEAFYRPGEHVSGSLEAVYFFGQPVAGVPLTIEGFTFDFERVDVFSLEGTTDENGRFDFEFDLPGFITGSDLDGGLGTFYLQAQVTDDTNATENEQLSLAVASSELIIEAIPEAGTIRQGVENLLYVMTSYPDGTPAETELEVSVEGQPIAASTGRYGLAEIPFTPASNWASIIITARDPQGNNSATREFYYEGNFASESVLLRPDSPLYRVGETMTLDILTSAEQGTVYLDIVRENQTISTRAVAVEDGRAQVAVDLSPDFFGTLTLHAYKILSDGTITRDTRMVLVDQGEGLEIAFNPDQEEYRPGDTANLNIQVSGNDGAGAPAALGLAVVDEAVFALAEQDPGFAKLYFLLEQELLQPRYELHGFSVPDLIIEEPTADTTLREAQEGAAQASLAEAAVLQTAFSLNANSREQNIQRAFEQQRNFFGFVGYPLLLLALLVPIPIFAISAVYLWRRQEFWNSLGMSIVFVVALALLSWLAVFLLLEGPLRGDGEVLLLACPGLGLVGLLGLVFVAWRRRDRALAAALLLLPVFILLAYLAGDAINRGRLNLSDDLIWPTILALALIPLSFLLRGMGFFREGARGPAVAATLFAMGLLSFVFIGSIQAATSSRAFEMDDGVVMMPMAAQGEMLIEEPAMEEAMAFDADESGAPPADGAESAGAPRLRQYFPETMFWLADGETDSNGQLSLEIPVADSITTWRLTALASTQDGRLGSATGSLRVFQPFFIDLNLPVALTAGDEIAIPVGIFNYLENEQTVRLEVTPESWFELLDEPVKEMTIAANDVDVVYFRIRALQFGRQPFTVTALGSEMSDAIRKEVQVYPDGQEVHFSESDRLTAGTPVQQVIAIPAEAIPGTQQLTVKIYPGLVSQVVEGLDSLLRMPYGCFEQTSSTTYPNVLILDYLQTSGQISPEVQFKAEDYINLGYQRLTTYEVQGGGFSLFGDAPASILLSAYGVQEFTDMSTVHNVDQALIERTVNWLLDQQNGQGYWGNDDTWVEGTFISGPQSDQVLTTAYVAWSLGRSGYVQDDRYQSAVEYLRREQAGVQDTYTLAMIANALVAADNARGEADSTTTAVLDRLAGMALIEGDTASWPMSGETFMGSSGDVGNMEATALATLAFLHGDVHPDLASKGILYLVQNKDNFGTWQTTQTTILALQTFITSAKKAGDSVDATVTVSLNSGQTRTLEVTPENYDVVQMITFDDVNLGDNEVTIEAAGQGNLMYQVTGGFYLPWENVADYPEWVDQEETLSVDIQYDRTTLAVNDSVNVDVTVTMNTPGGRADWAIVDLGVPPGFTPNTEDLAALVASFDDIPEGYERPTVERYELTGRQIILYLGNVSSDYPLNFSYRLTATFPLRAQTPPSTAYDYYNPAANGLTAPELLNVEG